VNVEIHKSDTLELVTAIEILLSPLNKKPGHEAFDEYLRKRRELLCALPPMSSKLIYCGGFKTSS